MMQEIKIETQDQAVELLKRSLPYPEQIQNIDRSVANCIYFKWRSASYQFNFKFPRVDKIEGIFARGDDASMLMNHCIKLTLKNYDAGN
jgi:hypothetical protein